MTGTHPSDLGFLACNCGFEVGENTWATLGEWNYPAKVLSDFDREIASIGWTYYTTTRTYQRPKRKHRDSKSAEQMKNIMVGIFLSAVTNSGLGVLKGCHIRNQYESFTRKHGFKTVLSHGLHAIIQLVMGVSDEDLTEFLIFFFKSDWFLPIDHQGLRARLMTKGIYYPFLNF